MQDTRNSLPKRRSIRLPGYDYRSSGAYFVTICTAGQKPLFGSVLAGSVQLSELGHIAEDCWKQIECIRREVSLDAYVVMPNHIHGILLINADETASNARGAARESAAGSLGTILAQYKSIVTKRSKLLRSPPTSPIWQRNFFDHIIRSAASLDKIRQYIVENPGRWVDDDLYIG